MFLRRTLVVSLLSLVAGSTGSILLTDDVPIIGPVLSSNFDPSESQAIENAKSEFPRLIEGLFESGQLNRTDLIFSVDVFSAATNKTIYRYDHVGEGQNITLTADKFDDGTIFRIGSVSKLIAVYALLAEAGMGVMNEPITKYLPELVGNSSTSDPLQKIDWDEITVGALASHQAGTGSSSWIYTNYAKRIIEAMQTRYAPDVNDIPVQELFSQALNKRPVISPFRNAMYSDAGFIMLGQVIARIAGKPFVDVVNETLFTPLGLTSSSPGRPDGPNLNAVNRRSIDNSSLWGFDVESVAASGGYYSSAADLRKLGLSILNSERLSAATTRAWMKPMSGTGSLVELMGAPWEISRLTIPVTPNSNRSRVSDLYIKAGGATDYSAILALSPDHGIGYSVLVAGSTASPARWPLRQVAAEAFIPAAEHAAVENAECNYAGTYIDEHWPGTNVTLSVNEGHPGLGVDSLYANGTDIRFVLLGVSVPSNVSMRIYPTGPNSRSRSLSALYQQKGTIRMAYRALGQSWTRTPRAEAEGGVGLFSNFFSSMAVDDPGLDEFVLEIQDGKLMSVTSTVLQRPFKRVV